MPSLGVIVGRFQVPELHEAHLALIKYAVANFDDVLILIGKAPTPSKSNPLPSNYVKNMILNSIGECGATIGTVEDRPTNEEWSIALDERIMDLFPNHDPTLLGGRDSFIPRYTGINKTRQLGPEWFGVAGASSGTEVRKRINSRDYESKAFYAGYIAAVRDRRDLIFNTVDILVTRDCGREVLLGRKKVDDGLRLPGGFVDVGELPEDAAARELHEETGIVAKPEYVDDLIIPDWRFRDSTDVILTRLYRVEVPLSAAVHAGDDLEKLDWHKVNDLRAEDLADSHKVFIDYIKESK